VVPRILVVVIKNLLDTFQNGGFAVIKQAAILNAALFFRAIFVKIF
jgi:hypothetical protein